MEIITGENNPILRQKSKVVEHFNQEVFSLIEKMKKTIKENNALGLAAIQIGVPSRVIVCRIDENFKVFINPEIIKFSQQEEIFPEGCLSLPGYYGEVIRPKTIVLEAQNENGKKIKIKAFGLLARVIQHEIDHLNGVLFIDKAKNIKKETGRSPL
ncbi:MAG: peptide deformylase [Minisyncoccia bacterium]